MKRLLVIALSSLILVACSPKSPKVVKQDQSYRIQKGMTQSEIIEIFGQPENKYIKKLGDVFYYSRNHPSFTRPVNICFGNKNKVSAVSAGNFAQFCQDERFN